MDITVENKPPFLKTVLIWAIIISAIGMICNAVFFLMLKPQLYNIYYFIMGGLSIIVAKRYRVKSMGGFISFGEAFKLCFIMLFITGVLCSVFSYVFNNYISPETFHRIKDLSLETARQQLIKSGYTDEQIEKSMSITAKFTGSGLLEYVFSIISYTIIGAIISLIVAAIVRKDKPEFG